jgi:hypothetical protein
MAISIAAIKTPQRQSSKKKVFAAVLFTICIILSFREWFKFEDGIHALQDIYKDKYSDGGYKSAKTGTGLINVTAKVITNGGGIKDVIAEEPQSDTEETPISIESPVELIHTNTTTGSSHWTQQ